MPKFSIIIPAHNSADRIAPEWNRICRKYGVGKSDDGFCDEVERKERIEE